MTHPKTIELLLATGAFVKLVREGQSLDRGPRAVRTIVALSNACDAWIDAGRPDLGGQGDSLAEVRAEVERCRNDVLQNPADGLSALNDLLDFLDDLVPPAAGGQGERAIAGTIHVSHGDYPHLIFETEEPTWTLPFDEEGIDVQVIIPPTPPPAGEEEP